jgi:hypothetical protein
LETTVKIVHPTHFIMLISTLKLVELFCQLDDFCIAFEKNLQPHLLPGPGSAHSTNVPAITNSEMMCIEVLYHRSGHKCFEYFYRAEVLEGGLRSYFPKAPSYNRFVELKPRMLTALVCYLHLYGLGRMLGIYYADSTTLSICRHQRINAHKVFKGKAERGKTTMGWFYGFKLFIVINGLGELAAAFLTKGNVADNNGSVMRRLFKRLKGLVFADKGFINAKVAEELLAGGLRLITKVRKNMKNKLLEMDHKLLLMKRGVIESVNDILKTVCDIDHSRHRSPVNMLVNTYAALIAYSSLERKPSIFA